MAIWKMANEGIKVTWIGPTEDGETVTAYMQSVTFNQVITDYAERIAENEREHYERPMPTFYVTARDNEYADWQEADADPAWGEPARFAEAGLILRPKIRLI